MRYVLLLLLMPSVGFGQFNGYARPPDARTRRAIRENAVAWAEPSARELVETGDEAALALLACSQPGAMRLVAFYAEGGLNKLPRPADALRVIAMHGDDVLIFMLDHSEKLQEQDAFDAWVTWPDEISLKLKRLDQAAAEMHAAKERYYAANQKKPQDDIRKLALLGGGIGVICLVLWRKRRNRAVF